MKLLQLKLSNFQGIKDLEFNPEGKNTSVYGTNATGKTTLYNAFTWLLFDKASTGEKGFSPKTKDEGGQDKHYLENRVEGKFKLDDGQIITFGKVLKENWVKKRGSSLEAFSGHTTDYYIDGVPVNKSEYDGRLSQICPTDKTQILTQPEYFPDVMSWQERRKLLLEVCGDITDAEVITGNEELHELNGYLTKPGTEGQMYSVDEYRKIAAAKIKEIGNRVDTIPARIDEASMAMPDIAGIGKEETDTKIREIQAQIDDLREEKSSLTQDQVTQDLRRRIIDIEMKMSQGEMAHNKAYAKSIDAQHKAICELESELVATRHEKNQYTQKCAVAGCELADAKSLRERLTKLYAEEKQKEWQGDTICPTCGQELPVEQVESARAKFNECKSTVLENLRRRIESECSKTIIAEIESKAKTAKEAEAKHFQKLLEIEKKINALNDELPKYTPYADTEEYAEYIRQIAEIEALINKGNTGINEAQTAIQVKIEALESMRNVEQDKLVQIERAKQQKQRIDILAAEEKSLNAEIERLQKGQYLCEQFIKCKVDKLDSKINGKFENVKFRLFETQINGGVKEDCEVMIPTINGLVPYKTANNAARLNAGLEIVDTLSKHWGIVIPVFVDNAERVVKLKAITPQVIRLVVPAAWEELNAKVQEALTNIHGSRKAARAAYEAPNKSLHWKCNDKQQKNKNMEE